MDPAVTDPLSIPAHEPPGRGFCDEAGRITKANPPVPPAPARSDKAVREAKDAAEKLKAKEREAWGKGKSEAIEKG